MFECPKCGKSVEDIFEHYSDCSGQYILPSKRRTYKEDLATHKLIKCPSCHEHYVSSSVFCTYCGWTSNYCAQCHSLLEFGNDKCPSCGWDKQKWMRYRKNNSLSTSFLCPNCNEPIEDWHSHCPTCFHKLYPSKSPLIKCPRCSAEYNANNGVCAACGWSELFCPVCNEYIDDYNMCTEHDWDLDMFIVNAINRNQTPQNTNIRQKKQQDSTEAHRTCHTCLQAIDEYTFDYICEQEKIRENKPWIGKHSSGEFTNDDGVPILTTALFSAAIGVGLTIGFMGYDLIASIGGTILFMIPAGVVSCVFAGLLTAHYIGNPKWWMCVPVGVILCILARFAGQ